MQAVILAATGAFIALAGWVARVTGLRADDDGLIILFARRPPFGVSWSEVRELKPPTSPVGGWRLTDARGVRSTLMPSDLFGHEELLETIVVRAGLQFDGRIWSWNATGAPGEGPTVSGLIPRKR
jgi:hypothetical protein